jgi:hypothetical protein
VVLALTLLMLGIALADNASHAVALHNFAMLTDRLHACANLHKTLRTELNFMEKMEPTGSKKIPARPEQ